MKEEMKEELKKDKVSLDNPQDFKDTPIEIIIPVYYREEGKNKVINEEGMREEFENRLKEVIENA